MQERAAPAAPGGHAVAQHVEDGVEVRPRERPEGIGPPDERPEILDPDLARRRQGDHLLGEDVERVRGDAEAVELARADRPHGRRRLHEVVPREREDDPRRHGAEGVPRATDALNEGGERARRADVTDEVDRADVDPELERRRRDHHRDLA